MEMGWERSKSLQDVCQLGSFSFLMIFEAGDIKDGRCVKIPFYVDNDNGAFYLFEDGYRILFGHRALCCFSLTKCSNFSLKNRTF